MKPSVSTGSGVCTQEWVILKECRYQNAGSPPATYKLDYLFLADTNFHTLGGKSAGFMHHFALDCVQLLYLSLCNWTQGNSTPKTKLEIHKHICCSLLTITIFVSLPSPRWTAQNKMKYRRNPHYFIFLNWLLCHLLLACIADQMELFQFKIKYHLDSWEKSCMDQIYHKAALNQAKAETLSI